MVQVGYDDVKIDIKNCSFPLLPIVSPPHTSSTPSPLYHRSNRSQSFCSSSRHMLIVSREQGLYRRILTSPPHTSSTPSPLYHHSNHLQSFCSSSSHMLIVSSEQGMYCCCIAHRSSSRVFQKIFLVL